MSRLSPRLARPRRHDADPRRRFDGVVCFGGEDWWYHNRGHYDMRMMRELSEDVPVLYVNSIGMRTPSIAEGRMFTRRIHRKLRSFLRGHVSVTDSMSVFTPTALPGRLGLPLTRPLLVRGVRRAITDSGIRNPLLWINCPTAAEVVEALDPAAVVYQRTDRYEAFDGVDARRIRGFDSWLKARADLTIFCSAWLHQTEHAQCRHAALIDHGVDSASIGRAVDRADATSAPRFTEITGPKVGFVGGIDAHTFDPHLLIAVARRLPDVQFVLVGACSLPKEWNPEPNIHLVGRVPLEEVPECLASFDALIMPWNQSPWIRACNPVKLKEYLATGKPIVSTDFPELSNFRDLVTTARTAPAFARALEDALREPADAPLRLERRRAVMHQTWRDRACEAVRALTEHGVELECGPGRRSVLNRPPAAHTPLAATSSRTERPTSARHPAHRARQRATTPATLDVSQLPVASILLGGGLRPSPLGAGTGVSVLDLAITPNQRVLDVWRQRLAELVPPSVAAPPIRIIHDAITPAPWPDPVAANPPGGGGPQVRIEQEPRAYRGPAGVLRDVCRNYGAFDTIFVGEAARYVERPLHELFEAHGESNADVTVAVNPDGSPAGLYLIRCRTLALVPEIGFMDLKEQWLDRVLAEGLDVRAFDLDGQGAMPLRTRAQLLSAARVAAGRPYAGGSASVIQDGDRDTFNIICPGAEIGAESTVIDSIVMPGAMIEPGAMVVRSLVCPQTRVQSGTDIADAVLTTGAVHHDHEPYCVA